jgi:hypothetical protein
MRSRSRLLSVGALALLLFALPGNGVAAGPGALSPGTGTRLTLSGGTAVIAPAAVPGATMVTIGSAGAFAPNGTLVQLGTASTYFFDYDSGGTSAAVESYLPLPAGAVLWQVDFYGYTTGATNQNWYMWDENVTDGDINTGFLAFGNNTNLGPGLLHTSQAFPSGRTLAAGHDWLISLPFTTSTSGYVGVVVQYTLPTLSFVPINPTRVLDTRDGTGGLSGPFTNHVARTFQVTGGSSGVPAGAKAVTGNLTVTQQTSGGYLYIGPAAMNNPTSSTLNFPAGDDRANGVTVALSSTGTLSITFVAPSNGPAAQAIFDVTGYYQ